LSTQPAAPDVVGDSRDRHVIWQVHFARKYLAEVHYAIGLVHEAAKDFQRAAEEFRLFHDAQKP
jgi:hypothetical protein